MKHEEDSRLREETTVSRGSMEREGGVKADRKQLDVESRASQETQTEPSKVKKSSVYTVALPSSISAKAEKDRVAPERLKSEEAFIAI